MTKRHRHAKKQSLDAENTVPVVDTGEDQAAQPLEARRPEIGHERTMARISTVLSALVLVAGILFFGWNTTTQLCLIWIELPILFLLGRTRWWVNRIELVQVRVTGQRHPFSFWTGSCAVSVGLLLSGLAVWCSVKVFDSGGMLDKLSQPGFGITVLALLALNALPLIEHVASGRYREAVKGNGPEDSSLIMNTLSLIGAVFVLAILGPWLGAMLGKGVILNMLLAAFIIVRAVRTWRIAEREERLRILRQERHIPEGIFDERSFIDAYHTQHKDKISSRANMQAMDWPKFLFGFATFIFGLGATIAFGALATLAFAPTSKTVPGVALLIGLWLMTVGWFESYYGPKNKETKSETHGGREIAQEEKNTNLRAEAHLLVILGIILACLPLYYFPLTIIDYRIGVESAAWPSTEGIITRSKITEGVDGEHDFSFAYSVNGRTYNGNKIPCSSFGPAMGGGPKSVCAEYPVGKSVTVYYRKGDPATSCLMPGVRPFHPLDYVLWIITYGVQAVVGAIGIMSFARGLRKFAKAPAAAPVFLDTELGWRIR